MLLFRYLFVETMQEACADVYAQNGNPSIEECLDKMADLPVASDNFYVDGNDAGCRKLHAVFAGFNDEHCPHLSFIPIEDVNGKIKCQTSQNLQVADYFTEAEIAKYAEYTVSNISYVESDLGYRVYSSDVPL